MNSSACLSMPQQALLLCALLIALSLAALFPVFSLTGTGFIFYLCVGVHLFLVLCALCSSLVYLKSLYSNSLLASILLISPLLLIFPDLVLPVTYRDALIHHLFIPQQWLLAGKPVEFSWHSWSYYPQAIQTVFVVLLQIGEWACVLYHAMYLWLLAGITALIAQHFTSTVSKERIVPSISALLILYTPVCLKLAQTPLVDLPLAFFCGLAIYYAATIKPSVRSSIFCGIALGAALSIKYNGLIFVSTLLAVCWLTNLKLGLKKATVLAAVSFLVAVLVYAPWPLRNYFFTQNPIYPLFNSFFGVTSEWLKIPSLGPWEQRIFVYKESLLELILLPLRMIFLGQEGNPRAFDGVATPLLIFSIASLFVKEVRVRYFNWICITIIYVALSLYLGPARLRYLAPVYSLLAVFSVLGLYYFTRQISGRWQFVLLALAAFQIAWGIWHSFNLSSYQDATQYISGKLDRNTYLAKKHPEYQLIQAINQNADGCIYSLYTSNAYYWFKGCVQSDGYQPARRLITWIKKSATAEQLRSKLVNVGGFSYLLINQRRSEFALHANLSESEIDLWQSFLKIHTAPLLNSANYKVYQIAKVAKN